jgi:hypothetical protein
VLQRRSSASDLDGVLPLRLDLRGIDRRRVYCHDHGAVPVLGGVVVHVSGDSFPRHVWNSHQLYCLDSRLVSAIVVSVVSVLWRCALLWAYAVLHGMLLSLDGFWVVSGKRPNMNM